MDALTFLGTGCGWPMADRLCSSLLLEADGRRWLLDAGEPCSQRLKAMGVPFGSLDAIFISHGHSDHLSGLPMIIQGAWLEGRTRPLPLYLPAELIPPIKNWLGAVYLPEKLIGFPLEYHAWENLPGPEALDGGRVSVSVNPTSHLYGLRALIDANAHDRFRAYSIAFDWPTAGRRLVYSADLGRPDDMDAFLLDRPCDLLVCELAHFTPEELFKYLQDKPVRRLCLTHPNLEINEHLDEVRALAADMLPSLAAVTIVRDGHREEF